MCNNYPFGGGGYVSCTVAAVEVVQANAADMTYMVSLLDVMTL